MAETHKDRVKALAPRLVQMSTQARGRLFSTFQEVYTLANSRMEEQLSSSGYGDYVALAVDDAYSRDSEYSELTAGLRKLRMLETAEAYYILYYFVLSLKELQDKSVMLDSKKFGEGDLTPSEIESLLRMRNTFLAEGDKICSKYGYSGNVQAASV